MAITYGDVTGRILQLLEDPEGESTTEELLRDAVTAALDAVLPWVPKLSTDTLTSGNTVYTLPTDFVSVEAVVNDSGEVLPKASLSVGEILADVSDNAWLLYPSGSITFSNELSNDYTLYYIAHWTYPTDDVDDDTVLDAPVSLQNGLTLFATAYAILPDAITIGEIRSFNTNVDSGNPEHNPRQKAVDFLLALFRNEMNNLPNKYQRVG
jgi:hypothetical protein